ncbi:MAG: hypothetical protein WC390_11320 [Sulfurimonas sp.]|jgi:hypothetical protein
MSNVIGSLHVNLSANTAQFESGLKRGAAAAKQFSREALANDIFKAKGGKDAAIGGGSGNPITPIIDDAKDAHPRLSAVQKLLQNITRIGVGGRNFRLLSGLGGAASELTGVSVASMGVVGALAVLGMAGKSLGDDIRATRKEAALLGKTYEELAAEKHLVAFSEGASSGLEHLSVVAESAMRAAKRLGGEFIGWTFKTSGLGVTIELLERFSGIDITGTDAEKLKRITQEAEKAAAKCKNIEDNLRAIGDRLRDDIAATGMSDIDAKTHRQTEDIKRSAAGGGNAAPGLVEENISLAKRRSAVEKLQAIGDKLRDTFASLNNIGKDIKPEDQAFGDFKTWLADAMKITGDAAAPLLAQAEAWRRAAQGVREQGEATKKAAEETKKAEEEAKRFQERLQSLTETPLSKFALVADDLAKGLSRGIISSKQYAAALGRARKDAVSSLVSELKYAPGASSALTAGSRELFNMQADRSQGPSEELKEAMRQTRLIKEVRDKMPAVVGGRM